MNEALDPALSARLDRAFLMFFLVWVLWHIAAWMLVHRGRTTEFRRRWHPRSALISALAFCAFVFYIVSIGFPKGILNIFIPAVVIVTFINIRNTRFCGYCGKQNFTASPVARLRECKRCGRPL